MLKYRNVVIMQHAMFGVGSLNNWDFIVLRDLKGSGFSGFEQLRL